MRIEPEQVREVLNLLRDWGVQVNANLDDDVVAEFDTKGKSQMLLSDVKEHLAKHAEKGIECPACGQFSKIYRRRIHATMAKELIAFYRFAGTDWGYLPDSGVQRGGDMVKVRYWRLISEDDGRRDDGSSRTGWWRLTKLGELWVLNKAVVPMYAKIYDGKSLGLTGEPVTIEQALGKNFNYRELMQGD